MALMCLLPLSGACVASFPHVLELSGFPPAPNPILESQMVQASCSSPMMPIHALDEELTAHTTLSPSLLQAVCKEAWEPIRVFHALRPSEVLRYCPSAISECSELACLLRTAKFICRPIFIPRQILEKEVFQ